MNLQLFKGIKDNPALTYDALKPLILYQENELYVGDHWREIAVEIQKIDSRICIWCVPWMKDYAWAINGRYSLGTNES